MNDREKSELDEMENTISTTSIITTAFKKKSQRLHASDKHTFKESKVTKASIKSRTKSKGEVSLKDLVPVSETADTRGCTFSCPICHCSYTSVVGLSDHLKTKHKCTKKIHELEKFLSNATVHLCRICSEKLYCESAYLRRHLSKHNITVTQYRKQFNCQVGWKTKNQQLLERGKMSFNEIGNKCIFRCPQCEKTFANFGTLWLHGQKCENHPVAIRIMNVHDYAIKVVSHKCKICSRLLFCDGVLIARHVRDNHRIMTLKKYAANTGCQLDSYEPEEKKKKILSMGTKPKNQVGNLCRYKCGTCGHNNRAWRSMQIHLNSKNHWSSKGKDWFRYISKTVLHECKICKKEILNDLPILKSHVIKGHKETWFNYVRKYKLSQVESTTDNK